MVRLALALSLALGAASVASAAVTGVAFVHGTGAQTNALADYWTPERVQSAIPGDTLAGKALERNERSAKE